MNHMEVMKLIVKDSDLSKNEIRVLLAILSFSRKQKKQIKRSYLSDLLNIHSQNISRTTKNLERKGYLSRDYTDGVCSYEIVMEMIRSQNHHSDGNETSQNHHFDGNDTPRHYIKDITVLDIDIQKGGSGGETDPIPYAEIIRDLNEVAEKAFMSSSNKTRELIKARWNEGFRSKDFFHVHKVKTQEWKSKVDMNKYLRPETLYSNKFHSYVNEKLKEDIQKIAEEEKMNAPETKEDIEYLRMLTGNTKQLN
jgi:uncharacterized phage protein (TIGR02220 family)